MNSVPARKQRFAEMQKNWGVEEVGTLLATWKIPDPLIADFRRAVGVFISKALHFEYTENEEEFINRLNSRKDDRVNITPNGAVVPKKEYTLEYNHFLKTWCDIVTELTKNNPEFLKKFRITPNIRVKYAQDFEDNKTRPQNTSFPHSDAWLEGPWGIICHMPMFGDTENNYLRFYKFKDENEFDDSALGMGDNFASMQWTLKYYDPTDIIPKKNHINFCDHSLLHETVRRPGAGTRVSVDTAIYIGDHDVHADRAVEYTNVIPKIGDEVFIAVKTSEKDGFTEVKNAYTHYTDGSLKHVTL